MLYAATTHKYSFDYHPGEVYFCTADIGWITGHTYITYGPLLNGATSVMVSVWNIWMLLLGGVRCVYLPICMGLGVLAWSIANSASSPVQPPFSAFVLGHLLSWLGKLMVVDYILTLALVSALTSFVLLFGVIGIFSPKATAGRNLNRHGNKSQTTYRLCP